MGSILEIVRQVVQQEMARHRGCLLGVVTAVFPHTDEGDDNNYEVNVRLKYEDLELRRVPIAVGHIGVAAPPRVDDLVLVQFVNGDLNQPVVTGRFYHADDRPPLHREDEVLFEHRVPDGTRNQLRFTPDGTIFIQRDVTKPQDNSEATAGIKIDGATGVIEIKVGDKITLTLTNDKLTLEGDVDIKGDLTVSNGANTTKISGNEITGA